jgi:Cu2+-exporting ATPase
MLGSRLLELPALVRRSRLTLRIVRHNLTWALIYNLFLLPLAVSGWLPAWLAGLGMAFSSLWVIGYSLRLSRAMPGEVQVREA